MTLPQALSIRLGDTVFYSLVAHIVTGIRSIDAGTSVTDVKFQLVGPSSVVSLVDSSSSLVT